jgi:hypothetical protein
VPVSAALQNVRFWHKADIVVALSNVRFWGKSGHRDFGASCLLLTQSGHSTASIAALRKVHSITSSAEACSASGTLTPSAFAVPPHKQARHMTAPDQCCSYIRKFLPRRRPHVTQSGHRVGRWRSAGESVAEALSVNAKMVVA